MTNSLPKHIAFIVDGNRRWAKKRGLSLVAGHKVAADKVIEDIVFHCYEKGVRHVTFWAFSTENWKRGEKFANLLFGILEKTLTKDVEKYHNAGIKLNTIGDMSRIPSRLVKKIEQLKDQSQHLDNMVVTIALNYGGRDEIVRAVKKMVKDKHLDAETIDSVDESLFETYLDTYPLPDVDLMIRTGGDQRTSGFLPWQSVYCEYAFIDTLFPDLTSDLLDKILYDFKHRDRRFGGN